MESRELVLQRRLAWSVVALIALAVAAPFVNVLVSWARADLTDPAALAKMPLSDLRGTEVEILIRAAFRGAQKVIVNGAARGSGDQELVIIDSGTLDSLGDSFSVGRDYGQFKKFSCPRLTYTDVRFDGPYKPNFTFTDDQRIYVYGGTNVDIGAKFASQLADLLGLDDSLR